jgi:hypothetical protein
MMIIIEGLMPSIIIESILNSDLMLDNGSHPTIKLYAQAQTAANNYCAIVAEYLCSNV